jgi:radical SAM-linked protein
VPRLRVRFSRGPQLKFISHLDIMRLVSRALRRAGIAVTYSEGFKPRPRLALAVPLALGVTSDAELMDVFLKRPVAPHFFVNALNRKLPDGIEVLEVFQAPPTQASLQSLVRFAEYEVVVQTDKGKKELKEILKTLLEKDELPWQHQRQEEVRHYDLRALVDDLWLVDAAGGIATIGMRLRCDPGGSGRPEQVAKAMGFQEYPVSIKRRHLILEAS